MWKNRWFQTSPKKANSLYVSRLNSGQRGRQTECVHALGYCYTLLLILVLWVPETCLCRRTFYRPTNWGRVGWGGMWYHSSVLQDMMRCNATHGVGWGVVWYHSSVLQDMMRCYARMGWGGVGCDIIRQYCKTWCDATLRMGWGWVWYYSSVLQDMMWCYSTHGVGWGGLWYHSSLLQDMMCCYATHGVGWGGVWYHSFPSPRQTQWFVVQVHSKSTMEMGTHWLRLSDRNWRSCKISHAVKRKGHFVRSSGFAAQNPVRAANHRKADVFFDGRLPHEIALAPQRNNNFWTIMGRCQVRRDVCAIGVLSPYRLDHYRILMIDPYSHIVLVSVGRLDRYHW